MQYPDRSQALARVSEASTVLLAPGVCLPVVSLVMAGPGACVTHAILKVSIFLQHLLPGRGMPATSQVAHLCSAVHCSCLMP